MDKTDTLYFVVPCYNEEEALPESSRVLLSLLAELIENGRVAPDSRVMFVDDGSKDRTWEIISSLRVVSPLVSGLKLSRNRGHQNALLAGLMTAKDLADVTVSLDADLQDDTAAVSDFLDRYYEGCDIVYGVRSSRRKDTFFKRATAVGYYRLLERMGVELVFNHADYRLMSKRALEALAGFKEVNLFLRGLVPMLGFRTATVEYERGLRVAGESKYPLSKMLAFAWQGITSMSVKPIRLILSLGILLSVTGLLALIAFAVVYACGFPQWQWTIILASIWAACGIQLSAIGVIGEYVGKIYMESKERPRFIIEDFFN